MNPLVIVGILIGLVALATSLGLLWRSQTGRVHTIANRETIIEVSELAPDAMAGFAATLLQFSTEVCAPCKATHTLLDELASRSSGVSHVDVDVTRRADIASRFNLLQSPTTFILDAHGVVRARIGGAPRRAELAAELERILHRPVTAGLA